MGRTAPKDNALDARARERERASGFACEERERGGVSYTLLLQRAKEREERRQPDKVMVSRETWKGTSVYVQTDAVAGSL